MLPDSARTAPEAAAPIGCTVGQIVKSLVFVRESDGVSVLVLGAGDRRVDAARLGLTAPHAVFEVGTSELIAAIPGGVETDVS